MTYDLRRKHLIERQPGTQRYTLTPDGRRLAVFFTKTYTRIVCPALAELDPPPPPHNRPPQPARPPLARIRTRARRPHRRRRDHGLKT
jgi:hypothetical protein